MHERNIGKGRKKAERKKDTKMKNQRQVGKEMERIRKREDTKRAP